MLNVTATFLVERQTKGAVRYQEIDSEGNRLKPNAAGAIIGILYLRKAELGGTVPNEITVTIAT